MSGNSNTDRRSARRQATKDEIVTAAWALVREQGLAGLSMRDLGERVGMKAQSLYQYFASKHEIYDALFQQGYQQFNEWMASRRPPRGGALEAFRFRARQFFTFCTADPVRYQLLFQRTIPGFVPSPAAYAPALEAYERLARELASWGITEPAALDLWTAVMTGLTDQQISNDPGGRRWERLIDRAVVMVTREIAPQLVEPTQPNQQRRTSR